MNEENNPIENLRKIREDQDISLYSQYEQILRQRYLSLPPPERLHFLRGLEYMIADSNQTLALYQVRKHQRRLFGRTKKETEEYLRGIDRASREKIEHMLKEKIDIKQFPNLTTQEQVDAANKVGMPPSTFRSMFYNFLRTGGKEIKPFTVRYAQFCQYLLSQGYEPEVKT